MCRRCKRPSCIHPKVCPNLNTDHRPLLDIYHAVDALPKIKKSFIGSGVRYDLLLHESKDPEVNKSTAEYTRELIARHVSGRLKVAPEHTSDRVLYIMRKPPFEQFYRFKRIFDRINKELNLRQQIIPYFISSHPGCTEEDMAELAVITKRLDFHLLKLLNRYGRNFSDCLYCDAHMDTYRALRASADFFLASDGSYSGAAEQIAAERGARADRANIRQSLQVSELSGKLQAEGDLLELQYDTNGQGLYSRLTLIPVDWDEEGKLHHFLLAFETIRKSSEGRADAKEQLTLYYEQLKQSILENDSYVDALLDLSDMIYTVNLTKDILEKSVVLNGKDEECRELFMDYPLPCSYRDYCSEYMKMVTQETLGSYRLADDPAKLLKRFEAGEKHISVEYCIQEEDGTICWVQKTVLMTQTIVFDTELSCEMPVVHAIILLQDTSQMHARDEQEHARLQAAFDEMRTANRAKTDFLSRMSHDIRTPLNGIIGLLKIDEAHFDDKEMLMENHRKMQVAAGHLLFLINDVLQMSKLEEGKIILAHDYISLAEMTHDIVSIIIERAVDAAAKALGFAIHKE